ncbi:phage head closure protein [Devosia rhodophyticola]|uniref:Phage head closure protein n=1 Tax=Devosia rhodophyticola TaxID=3026423 RepID=A0ABY7YXK8_9HYPH|nr:phage head closure protein [Devosia rhodophyticola]WDR05634.1 phage head closure protein [Devosia rhodophyticola]
MLNAGKLDRRITLERHGISYNSDNEPIEGYTAIATVWASWRRASAREQLAAAEIQATVTDIFVVRWSTTTATVTPMDRLVYNERTYNIAEATEIGRHEGVMLRGSAMAE